MTGRHSRRAKWLLDRGRELQNPMVEIARQDRVEYPSVRLDIGSDGTIRMDTHDIGPNIERIWDREDYEFSVEVPSSGSLNSLDNSHISQPKRAAIAAEIMPQMKVPAPSVTVLQIRQAVA